MAGPSAGIDVHRPRAVDAPATWGRERHGEHRERDFDTPDETRTPDKATVELVNLAGGQVGRYTFPPGWRSSACIKPVVGTDSCQVEHIGDVVSDACT